MHHHPLVARAENIIYTDVIHNSNASVTLSILLPAAMYARSANRYVNNYRSCLQSKARKRRPINGEMSAVGLLRRGKSCQAVRERRQINVSYRRTLVRTRSRDFFVFQTDRLVTVVKAGLLLQHVHEHTFRDRSILTHRH